ncbi:MAG: class I SAM-dependent methyltransferase [Anaerolineae bacterium]
MTLPNSGAAFEAVAHHYDRNSVADPISRWVRTRVYARLNRRFPNGAHVLELGCGTGEDALHLARGGVRVTATDISPTMLEITRNKAQQAGLTSLIETRVLDVSQPEQWNLPTAHFDGVYSNYGVLNCIPTWQALGTALAATVKHGGWLAVALIGRFCLWETLWHAAHRDLHTARRRWRGTAAAEIGGVRFSVFYPSVRQFWRALGSQWQVRQVRGLGVFIPPSDVYRALGKYPRLTRVLFALERLAAPLPLSAQVADQFWLEARRTGH